MISYFLNNTSAKNYHNRVVYVKIIASQRWDVFLRHSVICTPSERAAKQKFAWLQLR